MIEYDNDEYFCALYIFAEDGISDDEVTKNIATIINGSKKGRIAFDEFSIFEVKFDKFSRKIEYDTDFTDWPFRVECFPISNEIDFSKKIYKENIFDVIRKLRLIWKYKVVASCNFEDEIIVETGWNWTEKNQSQPSNLA